MNRIIFGTADDNRLAVDDFATVFGFSGDDTLLANWNYYTYYQAFLIGGEGDDRYIFEGDYATLVDTSGNDTLHVPGHSSEYAGAFVNGQDLLLVNEWTGQSIFILDARGRGRIETVVTEYGEVFSAEEIENTVYQYGYGDITYHDLEVITDGLFSADRFAAAKEINTTWADLDWDSIWTQIADRGDLSDDAIAEILNANLTANLSQRALAEWNIQGGLEQLKMSSFEGVEDNIAHHGNAEPEGVSQALAERVALLYEAALDRMPDISGLNYWIEKAAEGVSLTDISGYFIESTEFQEKYDASTDENFVDQLYLNVLDRMPDTPGKEYWLDKMSQGLSQAEVLNYFAISDENVANADWLSGLSESESGWIL
ncbi:MAG: DUF4214 domain-containing protein [Pseudomonadota bacterium]